MVVVFVVNTYLGATGQTVKPVYIFLYVDPNPISYPL